jgi:Zn-finger nucleic acid-binding protein
MNCPRCNQELTEKRDHLGYQSYCNSCHGTLIPFITISHWKNKKLIHYLNQNSGFSPTPLNLRCPSCKSSMTQFLYPLDSESVVLDSCNSCRAIWFDWEETRVITQNVSIKQNRNHASTPIQIAKNLHNKDLDKILNELQNLERIKNLKTHRQSESVPQSKELFSGNYRMIIAHIFIIMTLLNIVFDMSLMKQFFGIFFSVCVSYIVEFIIFKLKKRVGI